MGFNPYLTINIIRRIFMKFKKIAGKAGGFLLNLTKIAIAEMISNEMRKVRTSAANSIIADVSQAGRLVLEKAKDIFIYGV
jgi:predicted lipid-binding transport protein (Tim44 family)